NVHVVHVAGELAPFARSGGLGEAVNSLARFQAASGLPTSIVMPLYDTARNNAPSIEPVGPAFRVQVGPRHETVRLWRLVSAPDDTLAHVKVYFVESEEYFARSYIYGPPGSDYLDNARRYACFSMAAIASLSRIAGKNPVLLHVHDWHTALAPVYLRTTLAATEVARRTKVVLTVHNGGLIFADAVTTVSPTHAHELRTQAGGFGLDGVFVQLRDRFIGITNGIDQQVWDPSADPILASTYSAKNLQGKLDCRE